MFSLLELGRTWPVVILLICDTLTILVDLHGHVQNAKT